MSLLPTGKWFGDKIWDWFSANFVPWIKARLEDCLSFLHKHFTKEMAFFYAVWHLGAAILALWLWAVEKFVYTLLDLLALELPVLQGALLPYYVFFNRFLPLEETFAGVIVVFGIWQVVIIVRWTKSFIPFISN